MRCCQERRHRFCLSLTGLRAWTLSCELATHPCAKAMCQCTPQTSCMLVQYFGFGLTCFRFGLSTLGRRTVSPKRRKRGSFWPMTPRDVRSRESEEFWHRRYTRYSSYWIQSFRTSNRRGSHMRCPCRGISGNRSLGCIQA